MDQVKIGEFIQKLRKEKNMTQEELAQKIYLNSRSISKWERGQNLPDIENIKKLSEIFNVSQEEIMNGERVKTKREIRKEKIKNFIKKHKIGIMIFIGINLILYFFLAFSFFKNNNRIIIYDIRTDGKDFYVEGTITVSENFTYLDLSNIKITDESTIKNPLSMQYAIIKEYPEQNTLFVEEFENIDSNGNGIPFELNEALIDSSIHIRTQISESFDFDKDELYYTIWMFDDKDKEITYKEKLIISKIER